MRESVGTSLTPWGPKGLPRTLLWTLLGLNVLAFTLAVLTLNYSREHYREQAFVATRNIAQLLERDLTADLDRIDQILTDVQSEVEQQLIAGALQPAALDQLLSRRSYRLDERDALRVADAQGRLIYGLPPGLASQVQIADRPYFQRMRSDSSPAVQLSEPVVSRVTGRWSLVVARRLTDPLGEFAGIVYLALRLDGLEQRFASLDLGAAGAVSLRDAHLHLLARHSVRPQGPSPVGEQRVSEDLKHALARAPLRGGYVAATALDGIERANSYRRLERYPLLIIVGLATDDYLERWWSELALTLTLMLSFAGLSVLFAGHLRASWRLREQDMHSLATQGEVLRESEQRFRLLVQGVRDHAIIMLSPDGIVLSWNDGAERLKLWTEAEVVGQHFSVFYPPELVAAGVPEQHLAWASTDGHYTVEEVRVRKSGERFWASVTLTALHDNAGRLTGYAKLTRDITVSKRVELQERRRRTVLEMMLSDAPLSATLQAVLQGLPDQCVGLTSTVLLRQASAPSLMLAAQQPAAGAWQTLLSAHPLDTTEPWADWLQSAQPCLLWEPDSQDPAWCMAARRALGVQTLLLWPIGPRGTPALGVVVLGVSDPTQERTALAALAQEAADLCLIIVQRARSAEAQALAASVYQALGEAIVVASAAGEIQALNPAFQQLTGYRSEALQSLLLEDLAEETTESAWWTRLWQSMETTGRWQGEVRTRFANGEVRPQWWMISTIEDEQGTAVKRLLILSEVTDKKRAEEIIWREANYDPLTSLPNRRLFMDRLVQALKRAQQGREGLTLMLIDLDHFKSVNDRWGHEAGDVVLQTAAQRLLACVRSTDTVARWGGDEFTVLLTGAEDAARAAALAERMVASLSEPMDWEEGRLEIGASIGLCLAGSSPDDAERLLSHADQAMYQVKRAGRGGIRFYAGEGAVSASFTKAHTA
jgi:diguanylate cyclase (GGDEF)-like protein/PAS domain S-box-containing protein